MRHAAVLAISLAACSGGGGALDASGPDAGSADATSTPDAGLDASADAGSDLGAPDAGPACAPYGAPGDCVSTADCAALGDHTSVAGYCPGPADIECCIRTPSVADNPPVPTGYRLMMQSEVTTAMTDWAVAILHDPATYPMFSTTTMTFGTVTVLARVEWHPPDFLNMTIHRGVTLYVPL